MYLGSLKILIFYNKLQIFKMLKKNLEAIKSGDSNLYEHLVKVLKQMVLNNDKDSYQLFEYYSQKVKSKDPSDSQFRSD